MTEKEWKEIEKKWQSIFHRGEVNRAEAFAVFAAETKKMIERK